jgi:hypothetical protein
LWLNRLLMRACCSVGWRSDCFRWGVHFRSLRSLAFVGVFLGLAASPAFAQSATTGAGARFEMQLEVTGGQTCLAVNADDNIVWGTAVVDPGSDAASCAQIADDNIVWGTAAQSDNIIWGTFAADNDNIVWGTAILPDDNIVWGTVVVEDTDEY